MKNKKNLISKCLLLMKAQGALLGVNLDQRQLISSQKKLDAPEFIDFLTKKPINYKNFKIENLPNEVYLGFVEIYQTPLNSSEPIAYKFNRNGTTEQISAPKNKQSVKDYLTQKFIAVHRD